LGEFVGEKVLRGTFSPSVLSKRNHKSDENDNILLDEKEGIPASNEDPFPIHSFLFFFFFFLVGAR